MNQELISIIGRNKTKEKSFNSNTIKLSDDSFALGFYSYKGDVCVLNSYGMDITFNDMSIEDQRVIYEAIKSGQYK